MSVRVTPQASAHRVRGVRPGWSDRSGRGDRYIGRIGTGRSRRGCPQPKRTGRV